MVVQGVNPQVAPVVANSEWGVISVFKSAGNAIYNAVANIFAMIGNCLASIEECLGLAPTAVVLANPLVMNPAPGVPEQPVNQAPVEPVAVVPAPVVNQVPAEPVAEVPAPVVNQVPVEPVAVIAEQTVNPAPATETAPEAAVVADRSDTESTGSQGPKPAGSGFLGGLRRLFSSRQ